MIIEHAPAFGENCSQKPENDGKDHDENQRPFIPQKSNFTKYFYQAKKSFLDAQASALLAEAQWIQAKGETLEYED